MSIETKRLTKVDEVVALLRRGAEYVNFTNSVTLRRGADCLYEATRNKGDKAIALLEREGYEVVRIDRDVPTGICTFQLIPPSVDSIFNDLPPVGEDTEDRDMDEYFPL